MAEIYDDDASSNLGDLPYDQAERIAEEDAACPGCDDPHSDGRCCRCGAPEHPEAHRG